MIITPVRSVSAALTELAERITTAQAPNPLAPITLIVPSHAAGLDITRHLGRTLNSGTGSVGIRTFTLKDLALDLVAADPVLHSRAPLSTAIRQSAISKVLADEPGDFVDVADQPATMRAIARTAPLLDSIAPDDDHRLPHLVREVLRIHRTAAATLAHRWYTDHDLFSRAGQQLRAIDPARRFGTLIGFMLGTPNHPSVASFRRDLEAAGLAHLQAVGSFDQDTRILTASDADDEVRAVMRLVIEKLDAGVPGHRIGVFHSTPEPYRALLTHRFAQAGVAFVGPAAHRLIDASLARGLLQLLALDPADPHWRTILDVLAEGTLVWQGGALPSSATCERLYLDPPAPEDTNGNESDDVERHAHLARRREDLAVFESFVTALAAGVQAVHTAQSWQDASSAINSLIREFMGPHTDQELPAKADARRALLQLAGELGALDGIGPKPHPPFIRSTLEDSIAATGGWTGTSGAGVVVGGYADAVARDLDLVFLIGAAEGLAPARMRENPLLPDVVSALTGGDLPTVDQRAEAAHQQFLAALGAGSTRVITSPRGDLRGGGDRHPSRWLPDPTTHLASFAHGLERGAPTDTSTSEQGQPAALPVAATDQEWRLRHLLAQATPALDDDRVLAQSVEVTQDRRAGTFSRFNGNVGARAGGIIEESKALSPTRLEEWVGSPFTFFLTRILGVAILEDPDLEVQLSPMQRGTLVHTILEDYVRELTTDSTLQPSLARLMELADAAFADATNAAWLPQVWQRQQSMIRRDLKRIFSDDDVELAAGWRYSAAEAEFGLDGTPPVELQLDDGSTIRFRGKVDRIDRHADGRVRVLDYKTGKAPKAGTFTPEDPTAGGTRFQLPVYGLFARSLAAGQPVDVAAHYWFVSQRGGFQKVGYEVTDSVIDQLRHDAGLIISAICAGIFPPQPEEVRHIGRYRTLTTFTSLAGQLGMEQHWLQLRRAPELAPYSHLLKVEA